MSAFKSKIPIPIWSNQNLRQEERCKCVLVNFANSNVTLHVPREFMVNKKTMVSVGTQTGHQPAEFTIKTQKPKLPLKPKAVYIGDGNFVLTMPSTNEDHNKKSRRNSIIAAKFDRSFSDDEDADSSGENLILRGKYFRTKSPEILTSTETLIPASSSSSNSDSLSDSGISPEEIDGILKQYQIYAHQGKYAPVEMRNKEVQLKNEVSARYFPKSSNNGRRKWDLAGRENIKKGSQRDGKVSSNTPKMSVFDRLFYGTKNRMDL